LGLETNGFCRFVCRCVCFWLRRLRPWCSSLEQLETAAKHGRNLRPFAKILVALTALREKKPEVARAQLTELVAEFPENALFASELAKLNVSAAVLYERGSTLHPA
jgi:predicted Zn-dependent protease